MTRARVAALSALTASLVLALQAGCKLIAGYQDVALGASDAAPDEGGTSDGGCLAAPPTKLFQTDNTLADLIVANGSLYAIYTDMNGGTAIASCDPATCADPKVIAAPNAQLFSAATSTQLYTAISSLMVTDVDGGTGPDLSGAIDIVGGTGAGDGGTRAVVASLAYPSYLAVNGTSIFFADDPNNAIAVGGGSPPVVPVTIRKVPVGGGTPAEWITGLGSTYQVAVGSSRVFVLADNSTAAVASGIFACSLQASCGSKPQALVPTGADGTYGSLAVDGDDVYYASTVGVGDAIFHVTPDGKSAPLATAQDTPSNIVVDATHIYWLVTLTASDSTTTNEVRRIRKDGTTPVERVVCNLNPVANEPTIASTNGTFLAVDDGNIYVAESDTSGTKTIIERTAKP